MGCGGCGGGRSIARTMQKSVIGGQPKPRPAPKPMPAPRLRPTATTRIVISTPIPRTAIKVKQQLKDLKTCPLCGLPLSHVVSGSGVRNRKRCSRCNRTFI